VKKEFVIYHPVTESVYLTTINNPYIIPFTYNFIEDDRKFNLNSAFHPESRAVAVIHPIY
jgi:hypothetical protein